MEKFKLKNMTQLIILAGGKGTRMKTGCPKVLVKAKNKSLILHLLDSVNKSNLEINPLIVLGYKADEVKSAVGNGYDFVIQKEQLGTGHAVKCALPYISEDADSVMVLYGDHVLLSPKTISGLNNFHIKNNNDISIITIDVNNFNDWKSVFYGFGRIKRNQDSSISRIIELKDANGNEKNITEVNPGYYCFKKQWLIDNIDKLGRDNVQKEYYLTDLLEIAIKNNAKGGSFVLNNPVEGIGVNTLEQLKLAEKFL